MSSRSRNCYHCCCLITTESRVWETASMQKVTSVIWDGVNAQQHRTKSHGIFEKRLCGWFALQSANNLAQSQKSGKADDKKKNVEYAAHAWKQIVAKYQVCVAIGIPVHWRTTNVSFYSFSHFQLSIICFTDLQKSTEVYWQFTVLFWNSHWLCNFI